MDALSPTRKWGYRDNIIIFGNADSKPMGEYKSAAV
jgi:hypothetical protein